MDLQLAGKNVLITAASRGLGAACARQFSREGAHVAINARDPEQLRQTAEDIQRETGNPVHIVPGDLADPDSQVLERGVSLLGGDLDVLVSNCGGPPSGDFDSFQPDDWRKACDLVLHSAIRLIRAALPYLRKSRNAAILTITSVSAKQPLPNLILSNTLRPAVVGLTKSLSQELGPEQIRVNSILPGTTHTQRIDQLMQNLAQKNQSSPEEELRKAAAAIPLGRAGKPEEFANAAVFLCSPAAGYISGAALPVDGGAIRSSF